MSGVALELLKEWYKNSYLLGILLFLMGIAALLGGHAEASTVFPMSLISWIIGLIGLFVFALYFYNHVVWLSDVVGHWKEVEREEQVVRFLKVFTFFLIMILVTFYLGRLGLGWLALLLWLLLLVYPVAVIADNVSELDNILSSVEAWRRDPSVLLEFLFVGAILLLTAFYLEVALGWLGVLLSILLTVFFTLPFLTTLLTLSYLLRYPLTRRALEI